METKVAGEEGCPPIAATYARAPRGAAGCRLEENAGERLDGARNPARGSTGTRRRDRGTPDRPRLADAFLCRGLELDVWRGSLP